MRRILILVAVVAALGAALLVLQRRDEERARTERAAAGLLQFDDRRVTALILTRAGTRWRFEQSAGIWRVVEPLSDAADPTAVLEFLAAMRRTPVTRVIEEPEALRSYGLDPPVASVEIEGVEVPRLDLGDLAPTRDGVFAAVEGRPGVLVLARSSFVGVELDHPDPDRLREKRLLGMPPAEVTALEIDSPSGAVSLAREADGWWIVRPRRLPASDPEVERLLASLEGAEVRGFRDGADPSDPALGLSAGSLRFDVRTAAARRQLVIGAEVGEESRFATRDDRATILVLDASGLGALPVRAQDLVTRRLSRANRYAVTGFSYRRGREDFAARREGETWTAADGAAIPAEEVYTWLVGVLELPVTGWREGAGEGEPLGELRYELEGGLRGSVEFLPNGEARDPALEGVILRIGEPPPPVPRRP